MEQFLTGLKLNDIVYFDRMMVMIEWNDGNGVGECEKGNTE